MPVQHRHLTHQQAARTPPPQPSPAMVIASALSWGGALMYFLIKVAWDMFNGKHSVHDKAERLGEALERMGSTGARVGSQLALRVDLMPFEYSLKLQTLRDERPPMPLDKAMQRVREAVRRPLEEVFEVIEPDPIVSTSVDCTYHAFLLTGEEVAIKVRREGIRTQVLADLMALSAATWLSEQMALVRPGLFDHMRQELLDLANQELDFALHARSQVLFRQRAKRDDIKWLRAPKVFQDLSNGAVLVGEWVTGVRCSEVMDAVSNQDVAALERYKALDIDPKKVARRLLQASWWCIFENLFFISQPNPYFIVVSPGNRLTFLDFENRGTLSGGRKRQYELVLQRLAEDDVSGASQSVVAMLAPLPWIDGFDFNKRIESGLWEHLFAFRDRKADWWERTTLPLWYTIVMAARDNGVTLRLEVLRTMASCISSETVAARLNPRVRMLAEYKRYRLKADRRAARRFIKDIDKQELEDLESTFVARVARVSEGAMRLGLWIESTVEDLPVATQALSGKAAYAVSQGLKLMGMLLVVTTFGLIGSFIEAYINDQDLLMTDHLKQVITAPAYQLICFFLGGVVLRRVLFRLDDKGDDS